MERLVDYGENELWTQADDENMVLKMPSANVQPQAIAPLYDGIEE